MFYTNFYITFRFFTLHHRQSHPGQPCIRRQELRRRNLLLPLLPERIPQHDFEEHDRHLGRRDIQQRLALPPYRRQPHQRERRRQRGRRNRSLRRLLSRDNEQHHHRQHGGEQRRRNLLQKRRRRNHRQHHRRQYRRLLRRRNQRRFPRRHQQYSLVQRSAQRPPDLRGKPCRHLLRRSGRLAGRREHRRGSALSRDRRLSHSSSQSGLSTTNRGSPASHRVPIRTPFQPGGSVSATVSRPVPPTGTPEGLYRVAVLIRLEGAALSNDHFEVMVLCWETFFCNLRRWPNGSGRIPS